MSDSKTQATSLGFVKTFVLPGLYVFLIPLIGLAFFLHAQDRFNAEGRESAIQQIRSDPKLTAEEKQRGVEFFTEHPISELIQDKDFAAGLDGTLRFNFATFRWMIRLSAWSIAAGVLVFALAGLCVLLSMRSHLAQYVSLSLGWHILRAFCAAQVLIQGSLLVALSFWVTALWFHSYYPKLIFIAGALALIAVAALFKAIFKRPHQDHIVQGKMIDPASDPALWHELEKICSRVGTAPPDQVILGIDDNFFVTEMPITVGGKTYHGRTLYVSLSLLKQMHGEEVDAVLAHEMAHFSGQDTVYSKKISPLLVRYSHYLDALSKGAARPIYHFMACFRALYELSLSKFGRQREFRADRIAMDIASPAALASGLLRTVAYSHFRNHVQNDLFQKEQALESANICERIETGFQSFATTFASTDDVVNLESSHPFDRHPSIAQRLEAAGFPFDREQLQTMLSAPGDGRWYWKIASAEQFERNEWNDFEQQFRDAHERSLPYRFLPQTEAEMAVVLKAFPNIEIEGKAGSVALTFEGLHYSTWTYPVMFAEITNIALDKKDWLQIQYERDGKHSVSIKMTDFERRRQEALDAIGQYYGRYVTARDYQGHRAAAAAQRGGIEGPESSLPETISPKDDSL